MTRAISGWAASWGPAARSTWLRSCRRVAPLVIPDVGSHHPVGKIHVVLEPAPEKLQKRGRALAVSGLGRFEDAGGAFARRVVLELVPVEVRRRAGAHQA